MLLSTSGTRTTRPLHTRDAAPIKSKVALRLTATHGIDYYSLARTVPMSLHQEGHHRRTNRHTVIDTLYIVITAPRSRYICKSAQALSREWTPVRGPPGYLTPQAPGALLAHEFYRAASNLGTAIVAPLPASTQQPLAEAPICHPDPEIESAVINMECHEQASRDNNNNPW